MLLRPYQEEALLAIEQELKNHRSTLLLLPTGCGKTIVFSQLTQKYNNKNKKVLLIAHRTELLLQTQNKLSLFNVNSTLEKAKNRANIETDNIIVASIQSISKDNRLFIYPKDYFDLIIIDEAHHSVSDTYLKVIDYFNTAKLLGVTATPNRSDIRNISTIYETVAYSYNIKQAIDEGYLSPIIINKIPIEIDLSNVRTTCGDYLSSDLENTLEPYLEEIANQLREKAINRKILVFTPTIKIGEDFSKLLNKKGFSSTCISSKNTEEERKDILTKLHNGQYNIVTNAMLLTEGFDEPSIDCIINLRVTKSESLYCQILGRGLRLSPETNKNNLLVLDFLWHSEKNGYNVLSPIELFIDSSRIPYAKKILETKNENISLDELITKSNADFILAEQLKEASKKHWFGKEFIEKPHSSLRYRYIDNELDSILITNDKAIEFYTGQTEYQWIPYYEWELEDISEKQKTFLKNSGFDITKIPYKGLANILINNIIQNNELDRCSYKQYKLLNQRGFKNLRLWKKADASKIIDILAKNHWKLPYTLKPKKYIPDSLKYQN